MLLARMTIPMAAIPRKVSWVGGKVRKWRIPAGLYNALPYFYASAGLLAMIALRDGVAVFLGLTLLSAGGLVGLLRAQHRRGLYQVKTPAELSDARKDEPPADVLVQFHWCTAFESGHPLIDEQRRRLCCLGSELINSVLIKRPPSQVERLLDDLIEHIIDHFSTEESVLAQTHPPILRKHQTSHRALLAKAATIRDQFLSGQLAASDLVGFISCDVISDHVIRDTRELVVEAG